MSKSPPENPYASPEVVDEAVRPSRPLRPRWWEIGLFALLLSGVLLITGFSTFFALTSDVPFPAFIVLFHLPTTISIATMLVGGIMALRVWVEKGLHRASPPGHGMMMAVLLGSIIGVAGMIVHASSYSLGPPFDLLGQVIVESVWVAISAVTFALLWRYARWRWVGAMFLVVGVIQFCLRLFPAEVDFSSPREAISGLPSILVSILWLFAAFATGIVALREYYLGPRRDWLHWTGVICWILPLVLLSLHALVS